MNRMNLVAVAFLTALSAPYALADDADALETCVAESGESPSDCLDRVAEACLEGTERTTRDIVECATRETSAWDTLLNRWYRKLSVRSDKSAGKLLRDAQRAWIMFRDADCSYAYAQWADGTMRTVAGAYCQRDRTATRAIELHDYLGPEG